MALSRSTSTGVLLATMAVLLLINADLTTAKRGCTAFGHSCFGGHGKRSEADTPMVAFPSEPEREDSVQRALQETVYPVRAQQPPFQPSLALSPLIRQWLQSYRRNAGDMEIK